MFVQNQDNSDRPVFTGGLGRYLPAVIPSPIFSQYDCNKCSGKPNIKLKEQLKIGKLDPLFYRNSNDGIYEEWATSTLRPEGTPPEVKPIESDDGESLFAYVDWTCMYSAYNVLDDNPKTAWVEGVPGDGIGEAVIAKVDTRKSIKIWAGYGKSDTTFKNNNRPKEVRVYVLQGKYDFDLSTEYGYMISDIRVVAKDEVTLKDINNYQPLKLPSHTIPEGAVSFIAVEILSVCPGKKYQDTCISEISN